MPRTRIKICGVKSPDIVSAAIDAGADAIGFMFVRSSPRFIEPEAAFELALGLPPFITTVGVFMNASVDTFADIEEACPTHTAQLHGNEIEPTVRDCGPAIKAVRYDAATIRAELERWAAVDEVEAILVDGSLGGAGESFDWAGLRAAMDGIETPIILAGGLDASNVGEAIRVVRPYAVDVSSGVERERGEKDPALIEAFCRAVRAADAAM